MIDLAERIRQVEEKLGGREVYETIVHPDKVTIWLMTTAFTKNPADRRTKREGPVQMTADQWGPFSKVLLNYESYLWDCRKMCIPTPGALLKFVKGGNVVEVAICYECDMLEIGLAGKINWIDLRGGSIHNALVDAIQPLFPFDEIIAGLKRFPAR